MPSLRAQVPATGSASAPVREVLEDVAAEESEEVTVTPGSYNKGLRVVMVELVKVKRKEAK